MIFTELRVKARLNKPVSYPLQFIPAFQAYQTPIIPLATHSRLPGTGGAPITAASDQENGGRSASRWSLPTARSIRGERGRGGGSRNTGGDRPWGRVPAIWRQFHGRGESVCKVFESVKLVSADGRRDWKHSSVDSADSNL